MHRPTTMHRPTHWWAKRPGWLDRFTAPLGPEKRHGLRRAGRLSLAWATLAMLLACGAGSSDRSVDPAQEEEEPSASGALRALQSHLQQGEAYGEGPDGEAIATALHRRYPDDAIAVRVVPGAPPVIVVLLAFSDLTDISNEQREEFLGAFRSTLDLRFSGARADIGIGLRGRMLYGAVATRRAAAVGQAVRPMSIDTGLSVSSQPLADLLSRAPAPMTNQPSIAIGQTVTGTFDATDDFGHRRWVVTATEPTTLYLRGSRTDDDDATGVWAGICPGNTLNSDCSSIRNDETFEAALTPGTYTVFAGIASECDRDRNGACWKVVTPYRIVLE